MARFSPSRSWADDIMTTAEVHELFHTVEEVALPLSVVDNSFSPSRLTILHSLAYGIFKAFHPSNVTS
jgi:hypothetical protein